MNGMCRSLTDSEVVLHTKELRMPVTLYIDDEQKKQRIMCLKTKPYD